MLKRFFDPATLTLSRPQSARELKVLPLLRPGTAEPGYLTLGEALARGLTRVTEVSEGGSVPQLLFINDAMRPVLLLDGEELVGAKQNRVLNLAVLAPAHAKMAQVTESIRQGRWPPLRPGRDLGAAFIVRGRLVGAELFDSPRTFAQLLPKLVRSYGLDALDHSLPRDSAPAAVDGEFQAFPEQLLAAALRRPAVGLGEDLRIEAKEMVAAALVHEGKVVHLSAFVGAR
jgi:hypothetical protein